MSNLPDRLANILVSGVSENSGIRKNNHPVLDKMLKSLITVGLLVSVGSGLAHAEDISYQIQCEPLNNYVVYKKEIKSINTMLKPKDGFYATMDKDGTQIYDHDGNIDAAFSPAVKCVVVRK